jgi:hypothetical protein
MSDPLISMLYRPTIGPQHLRCLASVGAQTHQLEMVVVDDGSGTTPHVNV